MTYGNIVSIRRTIIDQQSRSASRPIEREPTRAYHLEVSTAFLSLPLHIPLGEFRTAPFPVQPDHPNVAVLGGRLDVLRPAAHDTQVVRRGKNLIAEREVARSVLDPQPPLNDCLAAPPRLVERPRVVERIVREEAADILRVVGVPGLYVS